MDKQFDLVALGENLVDFIAQPTGVMDIHMEGHPGGAPFNVLAGAARLGLKTSFITKLGRDCFGEFLLAAIRALDIGTEGVVRTDKLTTLAIVALDQSGDRSFHFYRENTADVTLEPEEVDLTILDKSRAFHFGSLSMTREPIRTVTLNAAAYAREAGLLVSYDPNLRPPLWEDMEEAKRVLALGLDYADVVKLSGEELTFLTGIEDMEKAAEEISRRYGIPLLLATLGPEGCICRHNGVTRVFPAYPVATIDTTGAGDACLAAVLTWILENPGKSISEFSGEDIEAIMQMLSAAGSLATTRRGSIPSLPTRGEIEALING